MRAASIWIAILCAAPAARAGGEGEDAAAQAALALVRAEEASLAMRATPDETAGWEAVAQQFLAAADGARLLKRRDEALYQAGFAFARARDLERAIALLQQVIDEHPASKLAPEAGLERARMLQAIGHVEAAAAAYARTAIAHPKHEGARDALANASALRAALGDHRESLALLDRHVRTYAAAAPYELHSLTMYLAARADRDGRTADARRLYERALRGKLDADDRVEVLALLGALEWRAACPVPLVDGLCARRPPAQGGKPQPLVAVARKAAAAARARTLLADATRHGVDAVRPERRAPIARAMLHLGEREAEAVLGGPMPLLDFDRDHKPTPASLRRLDAWMRAWTKQGSIANRALVDVFALRDPGTAIAAMARMAVMAEATADTILSSPVPRHVPPDARPTYTNALEGVAGPILQQAGEAARTCVTKAAELAVVNGDVAICQRVFDRLEPARFVLDERFARPGYAPVRVELEAAVTRDPTRAPAAP